MRGKMHVLFASTSREISMILVFIRAFNFLELGQLNKKTRVGSHTLHILFQNELALSDHSQRSSVLTKLFKNGRTIVSYVQ